MMTPKVIKSKEDNEAALAEIEKLIDLDPKAGTPEADKLELLTVLVQSYESKFMFEPTPMQAKEDGRSFMCGDTYIKVTSSLITIRVEDVRVEIWKSIYDTITRWYVTGDPDGQIGGGG